MARMTSKDYEKLMGKPVSKYPRVIEKKKGPVSYKDPPTVPKGTKCYNCQASLEKIAVITSLFAPGYFCSARCIEIMRKELNHAKENKH